VGTGSREENASNKNLEVLIQSEPKLLELDLPIRFPASKQKPG
jgi:hypothetical protein